MKSAPLAFISLLSTLVFFALVTPAGILMRAAGYDPLRLRTRRASAFFETNARFSRADFETLR